MDETFPQSAGNAKGQKHLMKTSRAKFACKLKLIMRENYISATKRHNKKKLKLIEKNQEKVF